MEKLGGGGHIDIAGAQLKNVTLNQAYKKGASDNRRIFRGGKSMKVILLKDVKGTGKKK